MIGVVNPQKYPRCLSRYNTSKISCNVVGWIDYLDFQIVQNYYEYLIFRNDHPQVFNTIQQSNIYEYLHYDICNIQKFASRNYLYISIPTSVDIGSLKNFGTQDVRWHRPGPRAWSFAVAWKPLDHVKKIRWVNIVQVLDIYAVSWYIYI